MNFIDLFAGAGGLSEGFIRAGFEPIAHVEMNSEACNTLKTRLAFHYLNNNNQQNIYFSYLQGRISRKQLWEKVPVQILTSVINKELSENTIENIFFQIDGQLQSKSVDVIIGGPPCQAYSIGCELLL